MLLRVSHSNISCTYQQTLTTYYIAKFQGIIDAATKLSGLKRKDVASQLVAASIAATRMRGDDKMAAMLDAILKTME